MTVGTFHGDQLYANGIRGSGIDVMDVFDCRCVSSRINMMRLDAFLTTPPIYEPAKHLQLSKKQSRIELPGLNLAISKKSSPNEA